MADPQPGWDKNRFPGDSGPDFLGTEVIAKLIREECQPLFVWMHDAHVKNKRWNHTFGIVYPVQHKGWTFHVIAHLHVKQRGRIFEIIDGHSYIPGYENYQGRPPDYAFAHVPAYDAKVTVNGWSDHPEIYGTYWGADDRYPKKSS
jgi:hypothetical protein